MSMHAQLELLLEMQDLHSQMDGLRDGNMREVESDLFDMNIDDAIELIAQKLVELEDRLDPEVRGRYRQMSQKGLKTVVPVLAGICYGCFMAVPTSWSSAERNQRIEFCENCGRFLYYVD